MVKQDEVWETIKEFHKEHSDTPTFDQLRHLLPNVSEQAIRRSLVVLLRYGWIKLKMNGHGYVLVREQ